MVKDGGVKMIGIYNGSKTPWATSKVSDKVLCLFKSKEYPKDGQVNKKSAHIIAYNTLFGSTLDNALTSILNGYVNMKTMETLTDKSTTIIFSKKDYNPFVTERTKQLKDIFLITLSLRGKRVIDISNENTFLLEGFIMGGELTVIASLNNFENTLQIRLLDSVQAKVVVYTFRRDGENNKMGMTVHTVDAVEADFEASFSMKKFRPSKPTHTIICYRKDKEQLLQVVDTTVHNIVEISKTTMEQVIKQLKDENYKAVTLFVNDSEVNSVTKKIYGAAMVNLSKNFKTYYELINTGKVRKIKL